MSWLARVLRCKHGKSLNRHTQAASNLSSNHHPHQHLDKSWNKSTPCHLKSPLIQSRSLAGHPQKTPQILQLQLSWHWQPSRSSSSPQRQDDNTSLVALLDPPENPHHAPMPKQDGANQVLILHSTNHFKKRLTSRTRILFNWSFLHQKPMVQSHLLILLASLPLKSIQWIK